MNRDFVDAWLKGKKPAEFDLIEFGGRILWPDKLHRLKADGTFAEVPVCVRVPRYAEDMLAHADAVRLAKQFEIDRDRDAAQFEQLAMLARAARAIREPKAPHAQFQTIDVLICPDETGINTSELAAVASRVELFSKFEDARIADIDEETAIRAAFAIDEVRNLAPLAAIAGSELDSCVISMAVALARSLRHESSARSPESSPPARSGRKS